MQPLAPYVQHTPMGGGEAEVRWGYSHVNNKQSRTQVPYQGSAVLGHSREGRDRPLKYSWAERGER